MRLRLVQPVLVIFRDVSSNKSIRDIKGNTAERFACMTWFLCFTPLRESVAMKVCLCR